MCLSILAYVFTSAPEFGSRQGLPVVTTHVCMQFSWYILTCSNSVINSRSSVKRFYMYRTGANFIKPISRKYCLAKSCAKQHLGREPVRRCKHYITFWLVSLFSPSIFPCALQICPLQFAALLNWPQVSSMVIWLSSYRDDEFMIIQKCVQPMPCNIKVLW